MSESFQLFEKFPRAVRSIIIIKSGVSFIELKMSKFSYQNFSRTSCFLTLDTGTSHCAGRSRHRWGHTIKMFIVFWLVETSVTVAYN